jgi:hypothetical protein
MKSHSPILKKLSRRRLAPLIKYCFKTQGAIADVVRRMEAVTGYRPSWGQVLDWLHPDPDKWQMPTYGNGIVLEMVLVDILTDDPQPKP